MAKRLGGLRIAYSRPSLTGLSNAHDRGAMQHSYKRAIRPYCCQWKLWQSRRARIPLLGNGCYCDLIEERKAAQSAAQFDEGPVSKTTMFGVVLGSIHLTAYAVSLCLSDDGWQRAIIFLLWQIVDLPVSVFVFLSAWTHYWELAQRIFSDTHVWAELLPLIVANGIAGTAWWFMLPRFQVWIADYYSN